MKNKQYILILILTFIAHIAFASNTVKDGVAAYNKEDFKTALTILEPLAKNGDAEAQFQLGFMYEWGKGVKQDDGQAVKWYTKAAKQGHEIAQNNLAGIYTNQSDYKNAFEWYLKAAEQGDDAAQTNLGFMYQNGLGVNKNNNKSADWYRKAAKQGNLRAKEALKEIGN